MCTNVANYMKKACYLLNIEINWVAMDDDYCMDLVDLKKQLRSGECGFIVASMGSGKYATVDDIEEIHKVAVSYRVKLHVECGASGMLMLFS